MSPVATLNRQLDAALAPLRALLAGPYALLDFPDHANVGDSAIWLGTLRWLQRSGLGPPAFVARHDADLDALARACPEGPLLLHGGGNFGDLWPAHQRFREQLLQRFAGRQIVQLPQTIHYQDPAGVGRTAALIRRHGAFTLYVRDRASLALAREHFECPAQLCPDLALALGPLQRAAPARHAGLMLLRGDQERALPSRMTVPANWLRADWLDEPPQTRRAARRDALLAVLRSGDPRQLGRDRRRYRLYEALATARLQRGLRLLSCAERIVTDRLHAHLLALLLDLPHVCLDNHYGKLGRWLTSFPAAAAATCRAATIQEALAASGAPA